ncbi:NAD(P)-dependent alcohol dehydrogenase [Aliiroseovarius sp. PrR006]|uniref:NAD(P)-dependent alcohol dehydrogenase n=1 Tax=Aliiroseovarius sp. PrR006 TaxID=2706883 RepID=UPI0013CF9DEE|nr:NAD(P)-dependent alcohol dehydrogenase [Aliiroseovarius sp. PrR006]NDW53256.1 NAD(P)-dependent alcohol dehydrogenase [Aliiroseovarius sp. PrR006]
MKAAVITGYGSPDRLELCDVPRPKPAKNEVRVRVHASTANRTDTATLRAHPFFARAMTGLFRPKMQSLGMDFAGVVDMLGSEVSSYQVGDRVFGMSPERFGAHAEYLCIPIDDAIAPIPDGIPFDQAVVGEGAWYAHGTTKLLTEGKRCLIYGASGAIGTAAVQLAKANGAYVVAVVGTRHTSLANALGADRVVNYEREDFTAIGETFDLVFDAVGKTSRWACRPLLKKGALYCATDMGPYWSNMLLGIWYGLTGSKRVRIPFPEDAPGFIRRLADLMAHGKFRGVFDRTYPLAEIASAFRYVESEQKTGIVVIDTLGELESTGAPKPYPDL